MMKQFRRTPNFPIIKSYKFEGYIMKKIIKLLMNCTNLFESNSGIIGLNHISIIGLGVVISPLYLRESLLFLYFRITLRIEIYIDSITIPVTTIDPTDITIIIGMGNILLILYYIII